VKPPRPDLAAYALVALCLVALVVLTLFGKTVPDVVTYLAVSALGVGGGVSLQAPPAPQNLRPAASSSPPPAANLPAQRPAPLPLAAEPPTGVFRMAEHAP
jgi:hypothetical protein